MITARTHQHQRTRPTPKLDGIPSPGLRRMRRMTADELRVHLDRLTTEIEHITRRLARLEELEREGADAPMLAEWRATAEQLIEQCQRLVRLVGEGRRLLDER